MKYISPYFKLSVLEGRALLALVTTPGVVVPRPLYQAVSLLDFFFNPKPEEKPEEADEETESKETSKAGTEE